MIPTITESDDKCMVNPPPEHCGRCDTPGSTIIGWNQYKETHVDIPYMKYYEIFWKCLNCGFKKQMSAKDLETFNSYSEKNRVWPKAMHTQIRKGAHVV